MIANTLLATAKLVAGLVGHSNALVADAVESLADLFSSVIVWRGLVVASEPADADHPYGHGKAEPIAAAVVSTMLLLAAASITIQATIEILQPQQVPSAYTLYVLVVVVAIKESLFRFVMREGISVESSVVRTDAWHHRTDAITSLAAGLGISISLIGGERYAAADDAAAVVAAVIIAWNGWRMLRPAMDELMDASPDPTVATRVSRIAAATPGVARVEKCLVRKMGWLFYVDMHVEVDPQMTVQRAHEIAHNVKDEVRRQLPAVHDVLVHIEPAGQTEAARGQKAEGRGQSSKIRG
jgi:cation diffusion facilitator family transporter